MAGILDKKTRIMDVIVTREGRRQMADGNLRATFASFTDKHAFYEKDPSNGSTDPTTRIYFEPSSLSSDQIIFEKDDSGQLIGDIPISDVTLFGDNIFKKNAEGEFLQVETSAFNSEILGIVTSSITNFRSQRLLSSAEPETNNPMTFDVTRNKLYFEINNYSPFEMNPNLSTIDVNAALPLFFDQDLGGKSNFKFMNPVHPDGGLVGEFSDVNSLSLKPFDDIVKPNNFYVKDDEVQSDNKPVYENFNSLIDAVDLLNDNITERNNLIYSETVNFKNTSFRNNMFCQIFENNVTGGDRKLVKLDIVKAGHFNLSEEVVKQTGQQGHAVKKVYFAGKTFKDNFGIPSFFRIFTIMFD